MTETWGLPVSHNQIREALGLPPASSHNIHGVSAVDDPEPNTLLFAKNWTADLDKLARALPSSLFLTQGTYQSHLANVLQVPNARLAFANIARIYAARTAPTISELASVATDAKLGAEVHIGHYAVIETGTIIGNGAVIGAHSHIQTGSVIEQNVHIGSHTVIGGPGFGFERNEANVPVRIPHFGGVVIGKFTEIGSHTTINSGTINPTQIGDHVKIGDQVHVSHNVTIGDRCLVISGSIICGSSKIEEDVWISPGAIINNKLNIARNTMIGLGSVVVNDTNERDVVYGVPARRHDFTTSTD